MKKYILLTGFLIFSSFFRVLASTPKECIPVTKKQIAALFDKWNESLKTGDPTIVSANYIEDAILLPTMSNKVALTHNKRIAYFKDFLKKKPTGKIDVHHIRLGCNTAIDTGMYTFTFADKSHIKARYTFTYKWDGKEWKISSHHSSVTPSHLYNISDSDTLRSKKKDT